MDNQNLQKLWDNSDKSLSKVLICYRLPNGTFKIKKYYFPVCSRCTGIYIGTFSYYVFVYFVYVQYNIEVVLLAVLMILLSFSDGLTQCFGFRKSNNTLKFATGLIAGLDLDYMFKWFFIGGGG